MAVAPDKQQAYFKLRSQGWNRTAAAKKIQIAYNTAKKLDGAQSPAGRVGQNERLAGTLGDPVPYDELCEEAKRAWDDFGYFQRRYLGRIPIFWQVEAAQEMVRAVESDDEEWIVLNAPPGSGKPVAVTELVTMGDGSRKALGEIRVGDWVISASGNPCRVSAVHEQGVLPTVRVTTKLGRSVEAALDHPFLTENGYVNASDLTAGQFLPLVGFSPVSGSYPSEYAAALAGYFVGDGCTVQGNCSITNADPGVIADVEHCVKQMGWEIKNYRRDPRGAATSLIVSGSGKHHDGPRSWLSNWGVLNQTSHTKRVPPQIFAAPNDVVAAFIGAYFACDGHATPKGETVEFYSVHRALLADVQSLLTRFGIASSLRRKNGRYLGNPHLSYRLSVRQRQTFSAVIPVAGEKGARLARVVQQRPFDFHDTVENVEVAGFAECRCLTVEGDHTFLVGDLPVHNSTCWTHDFPAWLTVRNRAITGLVGSGVQNTANAYIRRLKDTFERAVPLKADARLVRLGLAVDAEATLAGDFGRFKSESGVWSAEQFVVEQMEGSLVAEKEPTWSAFGREGGVLGMRYQFVIWDDLVSDKRLNSQDMIDQDREWYSDIAESRLEPGGTFILQGQRLGPEDLYGYALKMRRLPDELDTETEYDDETGTVPKYRHIVYKAHYEDRCEGNHKLSAPAYGELGGCLLYPRRLSYRRLSPIMVERQNRFRVVYQQEDVDPESVLVHKAWVAGDGGFVGCWDKDRDHREAPGGIDPSKCLSVVTVDPSPTQYWGITWWLIDPNNPAGAIRYLIDLERRGMGANKFLDFIAKNNEFVGLAEEWQLRSYELGIPITHWIVERNGAQQFMLQTDMIQQWQRRHGVRIIPHHTGSYNKNSEELGIQALIPGPWERGLIRLPGKNTSKNEKGRVVALKLVEEVTSHPHSRTTDCLMTNWFMEIHLPELMKSRQRQSRDKTQDPTRRPSWYEGTLTALAKTANVNVRHITQESGPQRMMRIFQEKQSA